MLKSDSSTGIFQRSIFSFYEAYQYWILAPLLHKDDHILMFAYPKASSILRAIVSPYCHTQLCQNLGSLGNHTRKILVISLHCKSDVVCLLQLEYIEIIITRTLACLLCVHYRRILHCWYLTFSSIHLIGMP